MSGNVTITNLTLQKEIDDLRAQAALLPSGQNCNWVLARADALEATLRAFASVTAPALQSPQRDKSS